MSGQFFPYKGLPVLFRDILYNLLGYAYAVGETSNEHAIEESLNFYKRLLKDNQHYVERKKDTQDYLERGCPAACIELELAPILFGDRK